MSSPPTPTRRQSYGGDGGCGYGGGADDDVIAAAAAKAAAAAGGAGGAGACDALCAHNLTQVLSWLGVADVVVGAGLVCKSWRAASGCREVWRGRMHPKLLALVAPGGGGGGGGGGCAPAPAPACSACGHGGGVSPARLFKGVYCTCLLRNGEFLERANSARVAAAAAAAPAPAAAPGGGRSAAWVATLNARALSWEYPLLDAALPLPPAAATHAPGDGSPRAGRLPAAAAARVVRRSAPINIVARRAVAAGSGASSSSSSGGGGNGGSCSCSPGSAANSYGSSNAGSLASSRSGGSSGSGGSLGSAGGARASGPFAVGCIAPSCVGWSELLQVVDLEAALQTLGGLPPALAAAALASGAALELSVWVAAPAPAAQQPPGEWQVVAAVVPAADAAAAAAEGVPLEQLAQAIAPFADQLPPGLAPAAAETLTAEAAAAVLATMRLAGTRAFVAGPAPAGREWREVKLRLPMPPPAAAATELDGGAGTTAAAAAAAGGPRLVVALRGRAGTFGAAARGGGRGPKFMAARAAFVPLDRE